MRFVRVACCQNLFKQAWMKVLVMKTMVVVVVVTKAVAAATVAAAAAGDVAHTSMMINR